MTVLTEERPLCGARAHALLRQGGQGRIAGAYSGAAYLSLPNGLLMLFDRRRGSVPFGIGVSDYAGLRPLFAEGTEVSLLADEGESGALTARILTPSGELCLRDVLPDGRRAAKTVLPAPERVREAASLLAASSGGGFSPAVFPLLGKEPDPAFLSSRPYLALALPRISVLLDALFGKKDAAALSAAAGRLIGLGEGLTPSGDDLLCGVLYCLNAFSPAAPGIAETARRLREALLPLLPLTGAVSRAYLAAATEDGFFEVVADFADALIEERDLPDALAALLAVGASSGGDIAAGFLLAAGELENK